MPLRSVRLEEDPYRRNYNIGPMGIHQSLACGTRFQTRCYRTNNSIDNNWNDQSNSATVNGCSREFHSRSPEQLFWLLLLRYQPMWSNLERLEWLGWCKSDQDIPSSFSVITFIGVGYYLFLLWFRNVNQPWWMEGWLNWTLSKLNKLFYYLIIHRGMTFAD